MPHVKYFWDEIEDNVIEEYDGDTGNTIVSYTTEPTFYGAVLSQDRGGQVRHYHFDGQGNTTELTDENGNVTDTRRYSAFGEVTESTGTTEFVYQFGGRWGYLADSQPTVLSIRRRCYSMQTGLWLSDDPAKFTSRDAGYSLSNNNTLARVDPSGRITCHVSGGGSRIFPTAPARPIDPMRPDPRALPRGRYGYVNCNIYDDGSCDMLILVDDNLHPCFKRVVNVHEAKHAELELSCCKLLRQYLFGPICVRVPDCQSELVRLWNDWRQANDRAEHCRVWRATLSYAAGQQYSQSCTSKCKVRPVMDPVCCQWLQYAVDLAKCWLLPPNDPECGLGPPSDGYDCPSNNPPLVPCPDFRATVIATTGTDPDQV